MSSIAVFLVLGGGAAVAANQLGKNSVGTKQLKKNAVTKAKLKKNSVTTAKIRNGAVTGAKVNVGTLGTVPRSAATDVVKGSQGVFVLGQQVTVFDHAGVRLIARCEPSVGDITARAYIESAADGTTFSSWLDNQRSIGPATPEVDREVTHPGWADSNGPMASEAGAPLNVTTAAGASFSGTIGLASEETTNTCWYWWHATIIS